MAATRKVSRKGKGKGTRKGKGGKRAPNAWNKKVMAVFHRERKTNKNFKLGDAMRMAKKE
jgi:hypothetical protein